MRFKPMEFGASDGSSASLTKAFPLSFRHSPLPIVSAKKREDSDIRASRNQFNVSNISNNLKVHPIIFLQTLLNKPSQRLTID